MTLPNFPNMLVSKTIIILTLLLRYLARENIPGRPDYENYTTGRASHDSSKRIHELRCLRRVKISSYNPYAKLLENLSHRHHI